jgi:hypothetical protein
VSSLVRENIKYNSCLVEKSEVMIQLLDQRVISGVINLYRNAHQREDWFGNNYGDLEQTFFNRNWLIEKSHDSKHTFLVFTDLSGDVMGSTSLIKLEDAISIDETQLDPEKARRKGIMAEYFRRFVPLLYDNGFPISTEFVLTPESSSLRKVLIRELGMIVTGILPEVLESKVTRVRKSEITAIKSPKTDYPEPFLIAEANRLYNIVAGQIGQNKRQEVDVLVTRTFESFRSEEVKTNVPESLQRQKDLYLNDFRPLVYNPMTQTLTMGRIPKSLDPENLRFLETEESKFIKGNLLGMQANTQLLNYLSSLRGKR